MAQTVTSYVCGEILRGAHSKRAAVGPRKCLLTPRLVVVGAVLRLAPGQSQGTWRVAQGGSLARQRENRVTFPNELI